MMISVVIPLYNKEKSIRATLESVRAQSYTDWECIVVDDGSTDKSREVAEQFKIEDSRFKILSKPNGGVCSARNRGIIEAKGYYIALLDGDDLWDKDFLKEQVILIHDFPEAKMWGINFAEMKDGQLVRKLETKLPEGYRGYVDNYFEMKGRVSDLFCSSSVVIRRDVFDKIGMFDERIKYAEDSDMWFRIIATHRVAFYDKYMVFYQWDAENRALNREIQLKYFLAYYIDKYRDPQYKQNKVFYTWINRWGAQQLKKYYFHIPKQHSEAVDATKKLDYRELPFKYRLYYKMPFRIGEIVYKFLK